MHPHGCTRYLHPHPHLAPFAIRVKVLLSCCITAPLNVLPHHSVGRNELASVQADWALFSRACSLLVACGLVRLRILARSRIHMHRVYKHALSREETQSHEYITRTWRSARASRSSVAGLQAAVAIGRGRRHAPIPKERKGRRLPQPTGL